MSHLEKNYPLNTRIIGELIHLKEVTLFRIIQWSGPKIDPLDGIFPRRPISVHCSIFNRISPIRGVWWGFHQNDSHWLIWTQAWAISAENWDTAFFQWSITWYVRKKIGVGKFWVFLHYRNASLNGGETAWLRNRIRSDTTKRRLLWIKGYFGRHFRIVGVKLIVHFP